MVGMTESLNLGRGYSDYMPPSFVTEALKQVASTSEPLIPEYTHTFVRKKSVQHFCVTHA